MKKSLQGTQTEKNLMASFAGESQARMRYTYFASKAKKEGFEQIGAIFAETADQEKEHAERFFKFLEGGMVEVKASFPAGVIADTASNLSAAAAGEYEEWADLYPAFAKVARDEGFADIGYVWDCVCVAEKQHEKRYRDLLKNVKEGLVFKRATKVMWRCRNCGYLHFGEEAPKLCPACAHPQAYFELLGENW